MKTEDIKKMALAWQEVQEKAKKKMDPVGKADADIDNDGDVDKSDSYLHNRRKAISKNIKKDQSVETQSESRWPVLARIMEKIHAGKGKITQGAMAAQDANDMDMPSTKKMRDDMTDKQPAPEKEFEKAGVVDASKAAKAGPSAASDPHLKGANKGDKAIVKPVAGAVTK